MLVVVGKKAGFVFFSLNVGVPLERIKNEKDVTLGTKSFRLGKDIIPIKIARIDVVQGGEEMREREKECNTHTHQFEKARKDAHAISVFTIEKQ